MNLDEKLVEDKFVGFGDNQIEKYDKTLMKQNLELQSMNCNC